jgi:hypothetical protein
VNNISDSILLAVKPNSIIVLDGFTGAFQNIFRGILKVIHHLGLLKDFIQVNMLRCKVFMGRQLIFEENCEILNKTDIFENTIKDNEELGERYFYSGGNLRLLINFSQNDTILMLNSSFEKVQNLYIF